jgi:superfamily I DNA/RNA helicase
VLFSRLSPNALSRRHRPRTESMPRILPQDWRPTGVDDLEPQAWRALQQPGCACVVAGPGAGKTEFLAQRAVYLLATGVCPPPRRVLAISFKTDAADNLAARVRQRCPPVLAGRFVSLTFDAFTKSLVDRFLSAIPNDWRPTSPYDIAFPTRRQVDGFLDVTRVEAPRAWQAAIAELRSDTFESRNVGSHRLPLTRVEPSSGVEYAIGRWWNASLRERARSSLTFVTINRLAELLLRATPHILRALRATYRFVFVDEFQDTTFAQYDFLRSAFADDRVAVTAVGDDKQRIMVWAGARTDAFERFRADFRAAVFQLALNFRSSSDLVRIQHIVALALDADAIPTVARIARQVDGDVAQVWNSPTKIAEANHLARWLADDMTQRRRGPRDYALLVRQKADDFENDLAGPLATLGLRIRNESHVLGRTTLQDLLSDDLCRIAIAVLRLGATRRAREGWRIASAAVEELRGANPEDESACHRVENELTSFLADLRVAMASASPSADSAKAIANRVFAFLDLGAVARSYLHYRTGDILLIMVEAFHMHLAACAHGAANWSECLDAFEGVAQVPLMTVHKSKGLEYDTIIFVGLDDQAWWSHSRDNPEGLATFFVALSRAKQRAIFSFCQERGERQRVADLYQLLTQAEVPEIAISSG